MIFPSPAKLPTRHSDEHRFCFLSGDNTKVCVILIGNSFSFSDAGSDFFLQLISVECAERALSGLTTLLAITCCFGSIARKWDKLSYLGVINFWEDKGTYYIILFISFSSLCNNIIYGTYAYLLLSFILPGLIISSAWWCGNCKPKQLSCIVPVYSWKLYEKHGNSFSPFFIILAWVHLSSLNASCFTICKCRRHKSHTDCCLYIL